MRPRPQALPDPRRPSGDKDSKRMTCCNTSLRNFTREILGVASREKRVTSATIALITNARCNSACASFVRTFDENDFAPIVGEPTAAASSPKRLRVPLQARDGKDLGIATIAISWSVSKSGVVTEGLLPKIDAPLERTFDNRDAHDAKLVDAAIGQIKSYAYPKP
jgi:hypothetical protein